MCITFNKHNSLRSSPNHTLTLLPTLVILSSLCATFTNKAFPDHHKTANSSNLLFLVAFLYCVFLYSTY